MKENLLQFIWKLKLFTPGKLRSTEGEIIEIISAGTENHNAGPDFLNAKLVIGGQLWAGNVEIHISSSDWYAHHHETDEQYDSVILHVVWEHTVDIFRKNNKSLTTLELKDYISPELLKNYHQLFEKKLNWINCENEIGEVDSFVMKHWIEQLYFSRLAGKASIIQQILKKTNNDWETTLFVLLAKNFGLKVNGEAFQHFATSLNFSIVRKVSSNSIQLEALFFGQAGLLEKHCESEYFTILRGEYKYLQVKYKLSPISRGQIQFFRLRPNNFPTIRLSQLASLYHLHQNLFSGVIKINRIEEFYELLRVPTSKFWETHYTFDKLIRKSVKKLTNSFIDLLLINTIIPIKFMYFKSLGIGDYSTLVNIVEKIKPEKNSIITKFNELRVYSDNAFETQALLQLKKEYCNKQHCLKCAIGKEMLKY